MASTWASRSCRTWTFTSLCPSGQCSRVKLVRQRSAGTDRLTLSRRGPGRYSGTGKFYAPLKCGGRLFHRGEAVPFTIQVHVTAAAYVGSVAVATRVNATYTNRSRTNLTRCVDIPGHDAASCHGHLVTSTGGAGP